MLFLFGCIGCQCGVLVILCCKTLFFLPGEGRGKPTVVRTLFSHKPCPAFPYLLLHVQKKVGPSARKRQLAAITAAADAALCRQQCYCFAGLNNSTQIITDQNLKISSNFRFEQLWGKPIPAIIDDKGI